MITKLTKKQIDKMSEYVDKWLKIGLSTENISAKETKEITNNVYKSLLLKSKPKEIKIFENPLDCWKEISKYAFKKFGKDRNTVWNTVRNTVRNTELLHFIYPYLDGHLMSSYFSFYDYFINEKLIEIDDQTLKNWEIYKSTSNLELIYPFDDICFVCKKPTQIILQNNILNNENGPSIKYDNNFKIYSLNGVTVAEEIVMTKAEDLSPKILLKEKNADVRREIVRKIGIERVLKELKAKVIEKSQNKVYELVLLDIGDNNSRPYLKMKNPSLGIWHIEGVPQNINSIKEALAWRDEEEEYIEPDVLS